MPVFVNVCPDDAVLEHYLRERLSAEEVGNVDSHIVDCSHCLSRLEQLVESRSIVDASSIKSILESNDELGGELPGYQWIQRIAAGGMGVVWRVRDLTLNRTLAIKVMKGPTGGVLRERFAREAQICSQLAHPYIVPVHAIGTLDDGRMYYTMKLVEGVTLAVRLREARGNGRAGDELLTAFEHLCQAVAFAHRKGVIHRDLKPQNVMVGRHGEVQLMDWGLAKLLSEAELHSPLASRDSIVRIGGTAAVTDTTLGDVIGTLSYMPPEQARGLIAELDERSDVFSLGAILCEILTSLPPYTGASLKILHRQAANADLGPAIERIRNSGASPELIDLALRCLSVDPDARPANAGMVAHAMQQHRLGVQRQLEEERIARERERVEAIEEQKRLQLEARHAQRRRRLTLCLSSTVLLLVGVSAVAGVHMTQEQIERRQTRNLASESLTRVGNALRNGDLSTGELELERSDGLIRDAESDLVLQHTRLSSELDFARKLDAVRLEYFTWSNGWFDCYTALARYATEFETAGWTMSEPTEQIATRVIESPVHMRIVAALDDWAWLAHRESLRAPEEAQRNDYVTLRNRLLEIARKADPDARVKDRLRDGSLWSNPDAMRQFAGGLEPDHESAELLVLVGKLLPADDQLAFWERCHPDHPADFWLNVELGRLLLLRVTSGIESDDPYGSYVARAFAGTGTLSNEPLDLARRSVGYYRAAMTQHPNRIGVHLDLAAALALSGQVDEAKNVCRRASQIPIGPTAQPHEVAEAHYGVGLALARMSDQKGALQRFEAAFQADKTCAMARWRIATTLETLGWHDQALALLNEMLKEEAQNEPVRAAIQGKIESLTPQTARR